MILHLITDRRRLCPDEDEEARGACLLAQARFAVAAEIDVIQLREADLDGGQLATLAAAIVGITRGTSTRVVVNERLDVALAAGTDGVHLRGDSFDASQVRSVVTPRFLIGRSVHSCSEVRYAGPVDYVIAGTVWATHSKPDGHPLLGAQGLADIAAASPVPVIGIGGVDARRAQALAAAGAAGGAAIGAFQGRGAGCLAIPLQTVTQSFRQAFVAANM